MSKQLALGDLLVSLFTPEELRGFLRDGPDGEAILNSLPTNASFTELANASVEAMVRRGLVDERLFERLAQTRPGRAEDIEPALRAWQEEERRAERSQASWDFFIAYARPDRPWARELYEELSTLGCRVFLDVYGVTPGEIWDLAVLDAQRQSLVTVVLLSSATGRAFAQREAIATGLSLARDSSSEHRVVPVYLEESHPAEVLPFALRRIKGLSVREDGGLEGVALQLRSLLETLGTRLEARLESGDGELRDLARRFFQAAGRQVKDSVSPNELYVPEPVEVCGAARPSRVEVRGLAERVRPGVIGYFVHRGELPLDTDAALDTLRVQGHSIVPIAERLMAASLQDDNAAAVLHEVSRQGRGGDNLFSTHNALVDRRFLFGRSELLARIGSALGRGEQILLSGTRKSGKTSFLNILRQDLEQPVAFIDLQRYDRARPGWVEELLHEVVAAYDRWGVHRHKDWPASLPGSDRPADGLELEAMLAERRRWHSERGPLTRLVVILDELERLLPQPGETEMARSFIRGTGALRALAQSSERLLSVIAADLRPAANRRNRLAGGTNPFFAFFQEVPLPLLDRESVDEMVRTIGRMMGVVDIETVFLEQLFALSGGHPFVARMLAGAAHKRRQNPEELHLNDLLEGIAELEDDDVLGNFFSENFWSPLDPAEQRLLLAVADGKPLEGSPAARASLRRQGLIVDGRISIGAFADWIHRGQSADRKLAATG